jgi:1,4-dihydroxy-2-naphthoate octaprenyltransferase
LPYYLGKKALVLFAVLYYATYIATIVMVILGILPPICLLLIPTIFVVQKNINRFFKLQDKATTFMVAIINYLVIMGTITVLIFISAILN